MSQTKVCPVLLSDWCTSCRSPSPPRFSSSRRWTASGGGLWSQVPAYLHYSKVPGFDARRFTRFSVKWWVRNGVKLGPGEDKIRSYLNETFSGSGLENWAYDTRVRCADHITPPIRGSVTSGEVLLSHVISQMGQTLIQMVLILLMSLYVFGFEIQYNLALAVVLIALQATAGMTFGFLMSSLCEEIRTANYFSLGIFYPYLLTSGIMWPLEAMPTVLRYISYTMPGTLAIQSLRNLIMKDWTLLHPQVFSGFLSSIAYIVVQMWLCLLVMKYKKV
uniref:ABC-2 type transporter transmembrane domain-containing protein n=1 Tax=Timema douglasi TaxID=61478 RepID=A0A7R8VXG0_TIMDO|nr:unnamed protein product [Timema douglasi]